MAQPDAETTYQDDDGEEVTREVKPRESLRHMKELHTFGKLSLGQQKLDAALAAQDPDNQEKTLNDFVTETVATAGERMYQEAMALGLDCAAALPKERVDQIFNEEQAEVRRRPPAPDPARSKEAVRVLARAAQRLDHSPSDADGPDEPAGRYGVARRPGVSGDPAQGAADGEHALGPVLRVGSKAAVSGPARACPEAAVRLGGGCQGHQRA